MNARKPKLAGLLATTLAIVGLAGACDESEAPQATATSAETTSATENTARPSASSNEGRYEVRSAKAPVEVDKKAQVELAITPGDDLKINPEFPWKLEFSDNANVQIAQKTVSKAQIDLADTEATFPLLVEANAAGVHELKATGDFSVCKDTTCYSIRDEALTFELEATEESKAADSQAADSEKEADLQQE